MTPPQEQTLRSGGPEAGEEGQGPELTVGHGRPGRALSLWVSGEERGAPGRPTHGLLRLRTYPASPSELFLNRKRLPHIPGRACCPQGRGQPCESHRKPVPGTALWTAHS